MAHHYWKSEHCPISFQSPQSGHFDSYESTKRAYPQVCGSFNPLHRGNGIHTFCVGVCLSRNSFRFNPLSRGNGIHTVRAFDGTVTAASFNPLESVLIFKFNKITTSTYDEC